MSSPFVQHASWIWSAEGTHAAPPPEAATPSHYQVRLFRRTFVLADRADRRLQAHVSADSRYVLYCNGRLMGRGPAKGDVNHHFHDTYDFTPELRTGTNVLAALVLDMSRVAHRPARLGAPCSVMTHAGGFLLEGEVRAGSGALLEDLSTDARWKVAVDRAQRFQNENTTFEGYQGYFEHRLSDARPGDWNAPAFDDSDWAPATVLYQAERWENRRDPTSPYGLMPRMIPMMEEGPVTGFSDVFLPGGEPAPPEWLELIRPQRGRASRPQSEGGRDARAPGMVVVPPRTTITVILDAGELTTAYPAIEVGGGRGSVLRLTYAEALRLPWDTPGATLLGRRQSLANLASHFADENTGWTFDRRGGISGWCDIWEPAGFGAGSEPGSADVPSASAVAAGGAPAVPGSPASMSDGSETFEPLHWRAFRYIGLGIATGDEPLTLRSIGYRFTAYPYRIAAEFTCSDPGLDRIWSVALRTMRLCAHETFEDCPYYEQMQYSGDTMITSKIGMRASGDYRLSRQALLHFDWSRLSDGLTQSRYPSRLVQIIPSWSLHWITNIRDYVYCSGDEETARALMPGVRAVLDWFRRHADDDGLPSKLPYWNITDWCPWWPRGVVPGAGEGATCIIAAQYVTALDETADLCRVVGDETHAGELVARADKLRRRLHERFWSEAEGLYLDRPGGPEISQYGNAWAIVCGAAGERERARMLERFPHDPQLAPGSFFWWHAGFRALEIAGAYDRMPGFLGPWHEMIEYGLTTFVEENSYWRSLCHAWSAHPALEFLTRVLGVTPRTPGFATINLAPRCCGLTQARGKVCTPRGTVAVAWRIEGRRFTIDVDAPGATPVHLRLPQGERREFGGGKFSAEAAL
jgi:hypothetical protein